MNVLKVGVEFLNNSYTENPAPLRERIESCLNPGEDAEYFRRIWSRQAPNVQTLYSTGAIFGYISIQGSNIFFFQTNEDRSRDRISVEMLVLSDDHDINIAMNKLASELTTVFNNVGIGLEILRGVPIHIYVFNSGFNDIYEPNYRLKASFGKLPDYFEGLWGKDLIVALGAAIIASVSLWIGTADHKVVSADVKALSLNICTASAGFLLAKIIAGVEKIYSVYQLRQSYKIIINDFSNFAEPSPRERSLIEPNQSEEIESPSLGGDVQ